MGGLACELTRKRAREGAVVRYRTTGVGIGSLSASWERKDDDQEIARRVLNDLEDHRMLWRDFTMEIEEHCVLSANRVREELREHLNNPEISAELAARVKLLRQLFRDFVSEVGPDGEGWHHHGHGMGTDPLSLALGRLRGLVGVQIGELAADYELEVSDDLATIVPNQNGWLFERFTLKVE